ncbi:MAG: Ig-like domain-containing protein, partial [Gemmatimonadota bacterium]|nr:Ig-like domain-containing protein [Gemmatimonadota bacterium]
MLPFLGSRGSRRLRLGTLLVTASAAVGSCLGDASGPEGLTGYFALAPSFESGHAKLIPLAQARVTLERSGQTTPAIDTIVPIQPGDSTVDLSFNVVLLSANETFLLTIKLISPAGDTVFQAGPIPVTAGTDPSSVVPIDVTFVYTGTGADAAGVRILTPDTTVIAGDEVLLTAEAFDDNESPLPGTPIGWASADPSKAQVADETIGRVLAGTERGTARITATLLTGQADTALITIQLAPAALEAESGSGQSGPVGSVLPDPLVARLTASDGGGVVNELVQFAVTGGGTLSATSALTDTEGRASVQWTLGGTGTQLVEATTARLPGVTAAFTATAEAPGLIIVDGDGQSALVGAAVAIAPTVRVTDPQGNPLPDVAVAFAVTAGGGSVTGADAVTDANGVAAVGSWVLGPAVGLNSLTASAQSFDPVTFTASATGPGGATAMILEAGDGQTAVAGTAVTEAPAVLVTDGSGSAVVDVTVNFAVTAGGGTLELS